MTDSDQAVGFYYRGDITALDVLPRQVVNSLHQRFVGHAVTGEWRLIWNPVREGVELIVALPTDELTMEAVDDLVEILEGHAMRPLTETELNDAVLRAEQAMRSGRCRLLRGPSDRKN